MELSFVLCYFSCEDLPVHLQVVCSFPQVQMFTTFMEVYQGHLKDCTDGSRNYHLFVAAELLVCLIIFVVFFQLQQYGGINYLLMLFLCVAQSLNIIILAPYKEDIFNKFKYIFVY